MPLGGGVLARFYRPGDGASELFLPGGGNSSIKKFPGGFSRGDGQAWN